MSRFFRLFRFSLFFSSLRKKRHKSDRPARQREAENERKRKKKKKKEEKEEEKDKRRSGGEAAQVVQVQVQVDSRSAVQWTVYFALRPVSPVIPRHTQGLDSLVLPGAARDQNRPWRLVLLLLLVRRRGASFFFISVVPPRGEASLSQPEE